MGSGEKLTEIAHRGDNPYRDVIFKTAWDDMAFEPDSASQDRDALFREWRDDAAQKPLEEKGVRYEDRPSSDPGVYQVWHDIRPQPRGEAEFPKD